MKEEIHIGKLIRKRMDEERRSANWLAKELSCTRANVYKIYEKSNIDIVRLFQISRVLDCDFFNEMSIFFNRNRNRQP